MLQTTVLVRLYNYKYFKHKPMPLKKSIDDTIMAAP